MENYTIILFILGLIILLTALSERLNWSSPIFLIISGIALSFVPGFRPLHIEPEIIFLVFLPPLLYDAAVKIPLKAFQKHFSTISSLAFGLVFLTTVGIAVIARYMIPGMTWSPAFLLGAILAATDAVAAIGITKKLGISHRASVILEGESLLNDASALVAYKFALASVMGSVFVWWKAGITFGILIAGGMLTGFLMAFVMTFLLRIVKNNATAVNSFILLAPFITYLLAEEIHVSGVIAVVILGFYIARKGKIYFSDKIRIQSENIWDMLIFLLNGLVFILIGMEIKDAVKDLSINTILIYSFYALIIMLAAIVIRSMRIFFHRRRLQKALQSGRMRKSKRPVTEDILLTFQESMVISFSGMRGIVSLAIALALPQFLDDGTPFPMRSILLFVTFMVILYSVIGQGMLLPVVIRRSGSGTEKGID